MCPAIGGAFAGTLKAMRNIGKLGSWTVFAGVAVAVACGGGGIDDESSFREDANDASTEINAGCPTVFPPVGAECTLPEGTSCITGACGEEVRTCSHGIWSSNQVVLSGTCPGGPPTAGTECSPCFPSTMTCDYDVDCEDGGTPQRAQCVGASWVVIELTCSDSGTPTDASTDAPTDAAETGDAEDSGEP